MKPFSIRTIRNKLRKCPGVKEICRDVWLCRLPRICADKAMRVLYQFRCDEVRLLLKLIDDEAMWFAHRSARARGAKTMRFGSPNGCKLFVGVFQKEKRTKDFLKSSKTAVSCAAAVESLLK